MKPTMQTYIDSSNAVLRANFQRRGERREPLMQAYRSSPSGELLLIASGSSLQQLRLRAAMDGKGDENPGSGRHTVYVCPL